ncbi:type II toxin-antitoxin system VapC family toxin [Aphanothece stagnina]|uniref:type II toxin-antitoxin system VapC family toxin n=1 Tax=Aphanothece stagnina TaxID=1004305 RepID=UPI00398EEA93
MTVDTSAVFTVLLQEPGFEAVAREFEQAEELRISAATLVECHAVAIRGKNPELVHNLVGFLKSYGIIVEPFTPEQAEIAARAYRDYGRGSGHPANLNLGDVYSYALAKTHHEPVLCTGDDLSRTDLRTRPEPTA